MTCTSVNAISAAADVRDGKVKFSIPCRVLALLDAVCLDVLPIAVGTIQLDLTDDGVALTRDERQKAVAGSSFAISTSSRRVSSHNSSARKCPPVSTEAMR